MLNTICFAFPTLRAHGCNKCELPGRGTRKRKGKKRRRHTTKYIIQELSRLKVEPWMLKMEVWRLKMEAWRVCRPVVADSHPDPDPH